MAVRHKRALQQHANAGKVPTPPRLFGYTAGKVDPAESVTVIDLFDESTAACRSGR